MSCDFGVWPVDPRRTNSEASLFYVALCNGDTTGITPSPAIASFYQELTAKHPEIDDVAEEDIDNHDLCPWSCAFDRSEGHIIMSCIWPKADYVGLHIRSLASKHGLAVYDPQSETIAYFPAAQPRKPWWKVW